MALVAKCPDCSPSRPESVYTPSSLLQQTEAPVKNLKKHKSSHSCQTRQPPEFWDSLSYIHLTRAALRELGGRNADQHQSAAASTTIAAPRNLSVSQVGKVSDNLNRFARIGGPDLSHLRGYSHSMDTTDPISQSRSPSCKRCLLATSRGQCMPEPIYDIKPKKTGPYDRNFQQNLVDHGVYPEEYEYSNGKTPAEPENWQEINDRLAQPRASLSPSKFSADDFGRFKRAAAHASKERHVYTTVIPILEGDVRDAKCISGGISFTNLDHLTDNNLTPGNPDVYYGARPEQLDRRLRRELNSVIIPSAQDDLPILPNFFLEVKGRDGSTAVAERQACYDGALGARGMYALGSFGREDVRYDNKAYTITSFYHGGQLRMFTSHPFGWNTSDGKDQEYCMHQLGAWALTGGAKTFREGATAYRNARDWAKEQRDLLIEQANSRGQVGH